MVGQIVEQWPAMGMLEGGLASAHAVEQSAPGPPMPFVAHHHGVVAQRAFGIAAQAVRKGSQAKAAVRLLGEDAETRERPQETPQCRAVGAGGRGEHVGRLRAVRQQIGDPESRGDMDRLCCPRPAHQPEQRHGRFGVAGRRGCHGLLQFT
jgi:hypothetical protein